MELASLPRELSEAGVPGGGWRREIPEGAALSRGS